MFFAWPQPGHLTQERFRIATEGGLSPSTPIIQTREGRKRWAHTLALLFMYASITLQQQLISSCV